MTARSFLFAKTLLTRKLVLRHLLLIILLFISSNTKAWVYPEHRFIGLLAIQELSPENRELLDELWARARIGYESRLTENIIDVHQGLKPTQLDYASWFAISGDHSCSPQNLLYNVLKTQWVLSVANIAAQLNIAIQNSKNSSQHINAIRESDLKLQRADPEYATRAGSNNVHFLLARPATDTDLEKYLRTCFSKGSPLNALGAYAWFHISAMEKAARYAEENLPTDLKSALILAVLADEAFALHFLEDIFAAGHIAGTWGNAALRKGTHDYYNEKGLEVVTWDGKRMVMTGDAYMRPQDAELVASIVRLSLEQLLDVINGKLSPDYKMDSIGYTTQPDSFNICKNEVNPERKANAKYLLDVLLKTPVPGLATGLGENPRFRSELGTFFGVSSSLNLSTISGGFGEQQTNGGLSGGIEANLLFGFGLEGVLNQSGDGLVFIQVGWRQDAASTNQSGIIDDSIIHANTLTSTIPARSAYNFRLRVPFWLIPGDLLVVGPILLLVSPKTLTKMAVVAGNGGLIPWQAAFATSIGRFQFMLGREIGITFYGLHSLDDVLLLPTGSSESKVVKYKSTKFDFPILEYRPFRSFSLDQSSSLIVQVSAGFDTPYAVSVLAPAGASVPPLKTVWHVGLRFIFDWRHYF